MEFLIGFLLTFPLFMMTVVIHEVSHGWVALYLGDRTALTAGRLSLNPFKHIDPVGTVILPLLLLFLRAPFVFGWAKPVPINLFNLRQPKRDMLWVGAAGPCANFLMAGGVALGLKGLSPWLPPLLSESGKALILINLVLGTFNLLPIPPLDGSRVLVGLLPVRWARLVLSMEGWGIVIVMGLLYLGVMDRILLPIVAALSKALGL